MSKAKQNLIIVVSGVVVAGLVFFAAVSREKFEAYVKHVEAFQTTVIAPVSAAADNYKKLTSDADAATLDKQVLSLLEGSRITLQDLYDGKENDNLPSIKGSDKMVFSIKLVLMEMERTQESIHAKTTANFDRAIDELNKIESEFEKQAQSKHQLARMVSWIAAILSLLAFAAIVIFKYALDKRSKEIEDAAAHQLQKEKKRVHTLSGFIEAMANGNYAIELDTDKNDELSTTLVTMRDKLKLDAEDDKRRNWATSGLAQIGEILRATGTSTDLYDSIVKFVVKYTGSNQGGLFILNDEDHQNPMLELMACYAFERKKFLVKRIELGQGLIGQCFLEKETVHLREVPQDYVRITSGLGSENPSSCLLVPLKVNDKVYGVLELASFRLYESFEIDLVEKFAETIAATISSVQINESTRILLERTQQQAEEMKSQEEEMRQNMEELSATQEEMQRKEREYIQRIQELEEQQSMSTR